jgi:Flp pilus assembly protein TadG
MVTPSRLVRDSSGSTAAEFALTLPLLLIFIFGMIDAGRFMWTMNMVQKASLAGARYAVVTNPVLPALTTTDFVGSGGLSQGDRIPASALPTITCDQTSCTGCSGAITDCTIDATAFANIVSRMAFYYPGISAANVIVQYRGSGLGFAGDPSNDVNWSHHSQISPLVTVQVRDLSFDPITTLLLAHIDLPSFSTTLTAEDLSGTQSN